MLVFVFFVMIEKQVFFLWPTFLDVVLLRLSGLGPSTQGLSKKRHGSDVAKTWPKKGQKITPQNGKKWQKNKFAFFLVKAIMTNTGAVL